MQDQVGAPRQPRHAATAAGAGAPLLDQDAAARVRRCDGGEPAADRAALGGKGGAGEGGKRRPLFDAQTEEAPPQQALGALFAAAEEGLLRH